MEKFPPTTQRKTPEIEWPTLFVIFVSIVLYLVATVILPEFSYLAATILLALVLALQSSLQHEVLHGHPFRIQWLNELLVFPAVGLFIPYERFRDTHLAHHKDANLTDPYDDPESNYLEPSYWAGCSAIKKAIFRFNSTLLGRLLIGPFIGIVVFWAGDIRLIRQKNRGVLRAYVLHVLGLLPVIFWIIYVSTLPVWLYFAAAYCGMSILKIRTFLEHRAHESIPGRTVIIEDKGPLSFLFLNNNLHSVHHASPGVPWYDLPNEYLSDRAFYFEKNRAYYYASYGEVFRRYFLKTKDPVPHPLMPDYSIEQTERAEQS